MEPRDTCLLICLILASGAAGQLPAHLPDTRQLSTRAKGLTTLMIELQKFEDSYNTAFDSRTTSVTSTNKLNDAIRMAGTMLSIAPMLILYFVLQKQFVESVDRAGITGE